MEGDKTSSAACQRRFGPRCSRYCGLFTILRRERSLSHESAPDAPQRTAVGELNPCETHRHTLRGKQKRNCGGCGIHFPFGNLTVEHVVLRSRRGNDHLESLHLLCGSSNSMKGMIGQAAFPYMIPVNCVGRLLVCRKHSLARPNALLGDLRMKRILGSDIVHFNHCRIIGHGRVQRTRFGPSQI